MNGSNLGEFTIESGASGLDQLGVIRDWDGHGQQLEYWDDQYCDMINGIGAFSLHFYDLVLYRVFKNQEPMEQFIHLLLKLTSAYIFSPPIFVGMIISFLLRFGF